MAYVWVENAPAPSESELWISKSEAARRAGTNVKRIDALWSEGYLRIEQRFGVPKVYSPDLAALIESQRPEPTLMEQCRALQAQNRGTHAAVLMEQAHRENHPEQYEAGYVPPTVSTPQGLPDPWERHWEKRPRKGGK